MPRPARFTIRAASALTGINPNTLRAWERRHGLVKPERTQKSYRLYTDADIERLRAIQRLMQQGISVGRVLDHLEDDAVSNPPEDAMRGEPVAKRAPRPERRVMVSLADSGLSGTTTIVMPTRREPGSPDEASLEEFAGQIEEAALRFDRLALERAFSRAVGLYSLRSAFYEALAPVIRRFGDSYLNDLGKVAEEHFVTAFARERLLSALAGLRPLHQQPRILCACAPGESHELGLMLLALEFGLDAVSTVYLGADVPPQAVAHAAAHANLRVVVLSATLVAPLDALRETTRLLAERGCGARVLIGGPAALKQREAIEAIGLEVLPADVPSAARRALEYVPRR